jgi:hypothetical protein
VRSQGVLKKKYVVRKDIIEVFKTCLCPEDIEMFL